jgi:hypothetical protein
VWEGRGKGGLSVRDTIDGDGWERGAGAYYILLEMGKLHFFLVAVSALRHRDE